MSGQVLESFDHAFRACCRKTGPLELNGKEDTITLRLERKDASAPELWCIQLSKGISENHECKNNSSLFKKKTRIIGEYFDRLELGSMEVMLSQNIPQATRRNQQQSVQNNNLGQMAFLMSLYDLLLA